MVMTHSDNKGLVLPPRVAQTQVVVIPVGLTSKTADDERKELTTEQLTQASLNALQM